MDLIEATFAQLGALGRHARCRPGAVRDLARRRHHRRHRRHRRVPAADLPAVLPDQPARGHRLPGARGVRDGPAAVPLRPARPRLRAAALVARVRAAGHHGDAADPRSARSAGDDPGRAVHELLGAAAGLRAADQPAVRRPAALRRRSRSPAATCSARSRRWSAPRCFGRTLREGHGAADGARAAELQGAVAHATRCSRPAIRASRSSRRPARSSWRSAS